MKKAVKFIVIALVALAALAALGTYAAARFVQSRIVDLLGEQGHAEHIHVGFAEIILDNVEIGAPPGWPAAQTLRAARVVVQPEWQALLSDRVSLRHVLISDYYLSALRTRDDGIRIVPTLHEHAESQAGEKESDGKPKRQIDVATLVLENGRMDFFDGSISTPPYRVPIEDLRAEIGPLHAPATADRTRLRAQGELVGKKRRGMMNIDGWVALGDKDADIRTTLQGVDVSLAAPYLQKQSPAALTSGEMDLSMNTRVERQQLNAQGKVTLRDLGFDNSGSTLMSLPRKAVLAAMEDRQGKVSFDFTVQGNLHDPQFSLNDSFSTRLAGGFAKALGVSVEGVAGGVAGGVGDAIKGLGGALDQLFGK